MSKEGISELEYSELCIELIQAKAEVERLKTSLNGVQKAISQLHEAIDAIEALGTALIEKK